MSFKKPKNNKRGGALNHLKNLLYKKILIETEFDKKITEIDVEILEAKRKIELKQAEKRHIQLPNDKKIEKRSEFLSELQNLTEFTLITLQTIKAFREKNLPPEVNDTKCNIFPNLCN